MTIHKPTRRTKGDAKWHPTGETNPSAILTEASVRSIRLELMNGASHIALAQAYGVTPRTIRAVQERQTWRHL